MSNDCDEKGSVHNKKERMLEDVHSLINYRKVTFDLANQVMFFQRKDKYGIDVNIRLRFLLSIPQVEGFLIEGPIAAMVRRKWMEFPTAISALRARPEIWRRFGCDYQPPLDQHSLELRDYLVAFPQIVMANLKTIKNETLIDLVSRLPVENRAEAHRELASRTDLTSQQTRHVGELFAMRPADGLTAADLVACTVPERRIEFALQLWHEGILELIDAGVVLNYITKVTFGDPHFTALHEKYKGLALDLLIAKS
jgi:hypothetical protein